MTKNRADLQARWLDIAWKLFTPSAFGYGGPTPGSGVVKAPEIADQLSPEFAEAYYRSLKSVIAHAAANEVRPADERRAFGELNAICDQIEALGGWIARFDA